MLEVIILVSRGCVGAADTKEEAAKTEVRIAVAKNILSQELTSMQDYCGGWSCKKVVVGERSSLEKRR